MIHKPFILLTKYFNSNDITFLKEQRNLFDDYEPFWIPENAWTNVLWMVEKLSKYSQGCQFEARLVSTNFPIKSV